MNDLPDQVKSFCKRFADEAKLNKDLQNLEDFETIQDDLNKLCQLTIKWLMLFNVDKCKVMHIGINNPRFEYEMTDKDGNTKVLKSVDSSVGNWPELYSQSSVLQYRLMIDY